MREEGVVLVPLEARFATAGWLEIQLRVVELDIGADQILHDIENLRIHHQIAEGLMVNDGIENSTNGKATVIGACDRKRVIWLRKAVRTNQNACKR